MFPLQMNLGNKVPSVPDFCYNFKDRLGSKNTKPKDTQSPWNSEAPKDMSVTPTGPQGSVCRRHTAQDGVLRHPTSLSGATGLPQAAHNHGITSNGPAGSYKTNEALAPKEVSRCLGGPNVRALTPGKRLQKASQSEKLCHPLPAFTDEFPKQFIYLFVR